MWFPEAPDSMAGHPENSLSFQVGHSACLEGVGSEFHSQDGPCGVGVLGFSPKRPTQLYQKDMGHPDHGDQGNASVPRPPFRVNPEGGTEWKP